MLISFSGGKAMHVKLNLLGVVIMGQLSNKLLMLYICKGLCTDGIFSLCPFNELWSQVSTLTARIMCN